MVKSSDSLEKWGLNFTNTRVHDHTTALSDLRPHTTRIHHNPNVSLHKLTTNIYSLFS